MSQVEIRELRSVAEFKAAESRQREVWGKDDIPTALLCWGQSSTRAGWWPVPLRPEECSAFCSHRRAPRQGSSIHTGWPGTLSGSDSS